MHAPPAIRRLHRIAEKGEAAETPLILVPEIFVFVGAIAIAMLAITLGLYFSLGGP